MVWMYVVCSGREVLAAGAADAVMGGACSHLGRWTNRARVGWPASKLRGPPFPPSSVWLPPVKPISTMFQKNATSWGPSDQSSEPRRGCFLFMPLHRACMRMPNLQTNVLLISSPIHGSNVREEKGCMKLEIRLRTRITWPKGTRHTSESMLQRCSQCRTATSFLNV